LSMWLGDEEEYLLGTLKFYKPWIFGQDATAPAYAEPNERDSRIPRCDSVAPMIVRTSTHGHVTAYQDSEGFVRTCYFEPQDPN